MAKVKNLGWLVDIILRLRLFGEFAQPAFQSFDTDFIPESPKFFVIKIKKTFSNCKFEKVSWVLVKVNDRVNRVMKVYLRLRLPNSHK